MNRRLSSSRRTEENKTGEGEKKEGEGEEKEEGEKEEEVDEASLTVSFLLCGCVTFVVSLFYLVNYNDVNIRQITWDLLSDTTSIFCAVLWYQGMDALFDEQMEKVGEENVSLRIVCGFLHFFFWYIGVQVVAIALCQSVTFGRLAFKSSCVLGAHLSGFAAKEVFNTIMQMETFKDNLGVSFVAIIIAIVALFFVTVVSFQVRNKLVYPKMREEQVDRCGEEIREVENDMVSLSVGFLLSAWVRFLIHGKLPSEELDEKDGHDQWQAWVLYLFSLVCAACACVCVKILMAKEYPKHIERFIDVVKMTFIMAMSWCLLFWGQWEIFDTQMKERPHLARILLAMIISYYAFFQIFVLDFIADHLKSKFIKRCCRLVTQGFGLCLAFAWEANFDIAIETIAEGDKQFSEAGLKVGIAFVLCVIVAPAWGMYILPKTMEEEATETKEVEKGEAGKEGAPAATEDEKVGMLATQAQTPAAVAIQAPEAAPAAAAAVGKPTEAWTADAAK